MAKKRAPAGSVPTYHATVSYKRWLRSEIKRRGWTQEEFAERIARASPGTTVTTAGISQLLGREDEEPKPSNTTLMPAINRALGVAPPPLCDPTDEMTQIRDMFVATWPRLSDRDRRLLATILEQNDPVRDE
jgi:hypothetical protein